MMPKKSGSSFPEDLVGSKSLRFMKKQTWKGYLSVAARTFHLNLLPGLKGDIEEPKVAIEKDRLNASIRCLIHIVPFSGAAVLLLLNFNRYYVGLSFSSEYTSALQFAAKIHEMTMIPSITTAFLSYIRYELTSKTGLPFGATLAGLRVTEPTYLWSPELWGSMSSKAYSWIFKLRLALAIIFVTLLVATVGPASAASMIPRKVEDILLNTVIAVNATENAMFPTNLTTALYAGDACIWDSLNQGMNPCLWTQSTAAQDILMSLEGILLNATKDISSSEISIATENSNGSTIKHPTQSHQSTGTWFKFFSELSPTVSFEIEESNTRFLNVAVSIQSQSLLRMFNLDLYLNLGSYENTWTTITDSCMDAFSRLQCFKTNEVTWNLLDPEPALNFSSPSGQQIVTNYFTAAEQAFISDSLMISNENKYEEIFFVDIPNSDKNGVIWVQFDYDSFPSVRITPCTMEMGWFPTRLLNNGDSISSKGPPKHDSSGIRHAKAQRDWLATANPFLDTVNVTAFQYLHRNMPNNALSMAYVTSTLVAVTLSGMSAGSSLGYGLLDGIFSSSFILNSTFSVIDPKVLSTLPLKFPQKIYRSGYGYGLNGLTIKISLAILILYCIVVIAHIIYSIITGISSNAWDSFSEIIALSLNSRPALELQNTCAGIQTTRVFEHKVRIASTNGNLGSYSNVTSEPGGCHLELLFPSQDINDVSTVMINGEYGALKEKIN